MQTPLIGYYYDLEGSTIFHDFAMRMREKATELGVPCYLRQPHLSKSWMLNVMYKAEFILRMMQELQCSVWYSDVDNMLLKAPELFDTLECEIAAPKIQTTIQHDPPVVTEAAVLFLRYCPRTLDFVTKWKVLCDDLSQARGDHSRFTRLWHSETIDKMILPPEYCKRGKPTPGTFISYGYSQFPSKREEEKQGAKPLQFILDRLHKD